MPIIVENVEVRIRPIDLDHGERIQWQTAALSFTVEEDLLRIRRQCIRIKPSWFIETHAIKIAYDVVGFNARRRRFVCECGRNAHTLYLPEGATRFRCQKCYKLIYRSVYEHQGPTYKLAKGDLGALKAKIAKGSIRAVQAYALRMQWELYGKGRQQKTILREQTKDRR